MAIYEDAGILLKLSDTSLTFADPAEDIRRRKVLDKDGEEIGDVDDLLVDGREKKVRFLQVASGGFLGLGETRFLIPVDAITRISDDAVHISQTREHIAGAPRYDPALVVDERYLGDIYGHYGCSPYWRPDYVYPPYPLYIVE